MQCMEQIQILVSTKPKPSSPKLFTPKKSLKAPSEMEEEVEVTPTKVLDVAKHN